MSIYENPPPLAKRGGGTGLTDHASLGYQNNPNTSSLQDAEDRREAILTLWREYRRLKHKLSMMALRPLGIPAAEREQLVSEVAEFRLVCLSLKGSGGSHA
jgi:hypothetical protein